ncbi:MAG TPA: cation diffusion facilitator family transporter [Noviherbaspirillum sp.]|uniref:cation diffusion facilitator family transporter n=1 Tax=Noviherbaspirillum sp. TaxID=1926288 RepID=UPI002D5B24E9|nr:cation diffusion facilitator family transporter [Noviherbaspirillum sp.]HYD96119.1 cation diffusion facilitator family transporter [Noviherbaspirillum sp.]
MPSKHRPASATHLHAHRAGDSAHQHVAEGRKPTVLALSVLLTLSFAAIEVIAGFWSNSLALISDAGHMVTDSTALGLALLAQYIATRPPSPKHSFGFGRAEALAAFMNGLAMLAVVAWIVIEAAQRFSNPEPVQGKTVFTVALIGLVVNIIVAWLLSRDQKSVNTRAALVHVFGDMLGSVAALAAGAVIYFTGWLAIDPLLSLLVSLLILKSTIAVLRDSYHVLMEGVPHDIDYIQVGTDIASIEGVLSVHDLHVWEMSAGHPALIGHLEIGDLQQWPAVLRDIKAMLQAKHGIDHVTLQAELPGMVEER